MLLNKVVLAWHRMCFASPPRIDYQSYLFARLLFSFMHIPPILLPDVAHFSHCRIVKKSVVLRAGVTFLGYRFWCMVLFKIFSLVAICYNLIFVSTIIIRLATIQNTTLKRGLHGHFLKLHNILAIDVGYFLIVHTVRFFALLCAPVHFFHLFFNDAKDRVGFELHWTRNVSSFGFLVNIGRAWALMSSNFLRSAVVVLTSMMTGWHRSSPNSLFGLIIPSIILVE